MNKKTLLFIGVGITILLIGVGVYFLFFRGGNLANNPDNDNPFGSGGPNQPRDTNSKQNDSADSSGVLIIPEEVNTLWKISKNPVSGATIFGNASGTMVRYVDKATGHIYEVNINAKTSERISNTTIPKTERIVWGKDAKSILFQYEKDNVIKTYFANISTTTATSTEPGLVGGKYLNENISTIASSPLGDKVFYSLSLSGANALVVANTNGSNESVIFPSHFKGWIVSWPKENLLSATTKASASVPGYMYFIDPKTKKMGKALGDILGLTTLVDKTGENILYSKNEKGVLYLGILNLKTQLETPIYSQTLPEKCAWSTKNTSIFYCGVPKNIPAGDYPDIWYQGLVSFTDTIWQFDASTGATEVLVDPKEKAGDEIDITNPILSPGSNLLIFINKKDYSLWGLTLDPIKTPSISDYD